MHTLESVYLCWIHCEENNNSCALCSFTLESERSVHFATFLTDYSHGTMAITIFIATNGLYRIQCKCLLCVIMTMTLNSV